MEIWKYELTSVFSPVGDASKTTVDHEIPIGGKILDIQVQDERPMLWVLVNPNHKTKTRKFKVYGTGWGLDEPESRNYIGTVQLRFLVWHFFEIL